MVTVVDLTNISIYILPKTVNIATRDITHQALIWYNILPAYVKSRLMLRSFSTTYKQHVLSMREM